MNLKIVVLDQHCIPTKAYKGDAGIDLYARTDKLISIGQHQVEPIPLGICTEIPEGYVGLLRTRSSGLKNGLMISGTVDSGYRGEYKAIIHNMMDMPYHVQPYEKIAQLVIVPIADIDELELVQELTPSERGNKGYGSSGK